MIEFRGELSEGCKQYLFKDLTKFNCFAAIFVAIVLSIPIFIVGLVWNYLIFLFLIVPVLMFLLIASPKINPQTKTLNSNIPNKLTIEEETIEIEGDGEANYATRQISDVKKVIDMGEWYHIIFYFPHKNMFFVCQKNLLVKGTIEEFEKLFEGKIVRSK